ncbi:hypothetical protein BHE74_00020967 [Ensete ventricosum]|nr:hypothetical protein BHE74_00020967 [Ensete ventricosum]
MNGWDYDAANVQVRENELFNSYKDEQPSNVDITIKGKRREDGNIFLRLRISDKDELDIIDYDVTRIADMIDEEVASLVPEWQPGPGIEEISGFPTTTFCQICASNVSSCVSLLDYHSLKNPCHANMKSVDCCHFECAEMHGRFEEITYQVEETELCVTEEAPMLSTSQSDGPDVGSLASRSNHSDEECEQLDPTVKDEKITYVDDYKRRDSSQSSDQLCSGSHQQRCADLSHQFTKPGKLDHYENEIRQDQRWLEASNQMEPQEQSHQQLGGSERELHPSPESGNGERSKQNGFSGSSLLKPLHCPDENLPMKSFHLGKHNSFHIPRSDTNKATMIKMVPADVTSGFHSRNRTNLESPRDRNCEVNSTGCTELFFAAKNFYAGAIMPSALTRTKSLPVDAVDA